MLRKKEVFTIITPIPGFIPRQLAIDILHSHSEVITLNPLVLDHKPIKAPRNAASDEYYSTWYEINQRIQYVPGLGKMGSGKISFNGCFHDMPWGLQTHIYAPMNVDLKNRYRIAGNQPGVEPPEPQEIGLAQLGAPSDGLYLRDDVEIRCNVAVVGFVKAQLKSASRDMVSRIIKKAELLDAGVLQGMIENGRLRTHNPRDRTSSYATSPRAQQQQQQRPSTLNDGGGRDGAYTPEPTPYKVPRPISYQQAYNKSPNGHWSAPYGDMEPPPPASPPPAPAHAELPGPGNLSMPVEMPGDYHFHAAAHHTAPPPPLFSRSHSHSHLGPPPHPSPTYAPSDRDSSGTYYSTAHLSRWSQSQHGSNPSRPASVQSDMSGGGGGGGGGMHSPGLSTHEEMPEHDEYHQHHHRHSSSSNNNNNNNNLSEEALRKLDPVAARRAQYATSTSSSPPPPPHSQAYAYNPADYVGMGGRAQSAGSYGYGNA